jgi:hypothetical protein
VLGQTNFVAAVPQIAAAILAPRIDREVALLAERLRRDAPYRTGALRASVDWLRLADGVWGIRMRDYGLYLSEGHRVANWGTAARPRRRYKTRGYAAGTGWIEAAFARWTAGLETRLAT